MNYADEALEGLQARDSADRLQTRQQMLDGLGFGLEPKRTPVKIDTDGHVCIGGVRYGHLTTKEAALLKAIGTRKAVVSKEQLFNDLYAGRDEPELKIIDVFVCKLRHKLGPHGVTGPEQMIETIWGRGYLFGRTYQFLLDDEERSVTVSASTRQKLDELAQSMDRHPDGLADELLLGAIKSVAATVWGKD